MGWGGRPGGQAAPAQATAGHGLMPAPAAPAVAPACAAVPSQLTTGSGVDSPSTSLDSSTLNAGSSVLTCRREGRAGWGGGGQRRDRVPCRAQQPVTSPQNRQLPGTAHASSPVPHRVRQRDGHGREGHVGRHVANGVHGGGAPDLAQLLLGDGLQAGRGQAGQRWEEGEGGSEGTGMPEEACCCCCCCCCCAQPENET